MALDTDNRTDWELDKFKESADEGGQIGIVVLGPDGHGAGDTAKFTVAVEYDGSDNAIYVGEAPPGTAKSAIGWRIKKITYDGSNNATDVQWADGVNTFVKEWDERASYSYS